MARRAKTEKEDASSTMSLASRLAFIKRRHHELILKPREAIAADLRDDVDDPYEDLLGADQMELADPVVANRG